MAKLTVKEYAIAHGRTTQGVYQLIRRHEKEMKAHMKKIGGRLVIDEAGQALLDEYSAKLLAQIPTMAIVDAPRLEDEYRDNLIEAQKKIQEAQERAVQLMEEKTDLQAAVLQKQEQIQKLMEQLLQMKDQIMQLTEHNSALQVRLLEAKPEKEPEPDLFDQEDGPADPEPARGPSDLYDPDDLEPDPEPIRRAAVADPGEGKKKKGFFARLFGL